MGAFVTPDWHGQNIPEPHHVPIKDLLGRMPDTASRSYVMLEGGLAKGPKGPIMIPDIMVSTESP